MTPLDHRRQLRGLVWHVRRIERDVGKRLFQHGRRDLVGNLTYGAWRPSWGTCSWCQRSCSKSKKWHRPCLQAYGAARGLTKWPNKSRSLLRAAACEECGKPGTEIDHRLAIGIAHLKGRRYILRAFLLSNLRWLCSECHRIKTAADRAEMRSPGGRRQLDFQLETK